MENEKTVIGQEDGLKEGKTFTQEEVNRIVQERITRDRKDRADYDEIKAKAEKFDALEEASKTELQKVTERANKLEAENQALKKAGEIRSVREKVSKETGVPANLLAGEDEESCKSQATAILAFKNPSGYPSLKDGGESINKSKPSPQQQFAEWLENS